MRRSSFKFFFLLVGTSFYFLSCYSNGKIAHQINDIAPKLSEDNITALYEINLTDFRNAKDDKEGSLYYAGLLWFWNEDYAKAEIAWKRSARTGLAPWNKESARLVCYLLTRTHKFNQIAPFVESLFSTEHIIEDPEIFSYYSRALWSDKSFETLKKLLSSTPKFIPTIKERVSVAQAEFEYAMWKSFLSMSETPADAPEILREFLIKNSYTFNSSEINIFLRQIPNFDVEHISSDLLDLIALRSQELSSQEQFDIVYALAQGRSYETWMLFDLLRLSKRLGPSYQNKILGLFTDLADKNANSITQMLSLLAIAELSYIRQNYQESTRYYNKGLMLVDEEDAYPEDLRRFIQLSRWRYLYSIIETNASNFKTSFLETITQSKNTELYSNLLEEQLSKLLRKNQQDSILKEYNFYISELKETHQRVELLRWRSIISRIQKNVTIDTAILKDYPRYLSDLPFDYLINAPSPITLEKFIDDWTRNTSSPTHTEPYPAIDLLISGHIKFGLLEYAYNLSLQHIAHISVSLLDTLSLELEKKEEYSQSLNIMRIASSINKDILQYEGALRRLYPIPYIDIVESLTQKPIEKAIMYGIMREESSFDYNIRSSANAVGLMQLLYTTALDIASRIDFKKDIDLTDPYTNITLGYEYMKYLIRVLDTPLKAIASYNGGMGNVWKWEKLYDDQDLILFADSLPFRETRNYIRKVSSSAMIYGLLYFGISPEEFQNYLLSQ